MSIPFLVFFYLFFTATNNFNNILLIQGDILLWIEGREKTSHSERSQKNQMLLSFNPSFKIKY